MPIVETETATIIVSPSSEETPVETIVEEEHSDAVEIAQIEADKEVTIAAIHAETAQAEIEARTEVETARIEERSEIDICREEVANLTRTVDQLMERLNLLTPPVLEVVETVEELETAPEQNLTQPDTAVPTPETRTEHSEESEEERLEEAVPSRVRKFIAI